MSDLYELQLAWELGDTLPGEVLDDLRWHMGLQGEEPLDGDLEREPLLAARGPALRIGGVLFSELARGRRGWSVTVRQEMHAEELPELHDLLSRLAAHAPSIDPVGQLRHYEGHVPELLMVQAGAVTRQPLHLIESEAVPFSRDLF
ncbi:MULTISPECIES: hypothetical protein [Streptomyces]|uniref:Uncharacterized protein n=2 Tax=Streptomyces TaxID=1883 RepID=A0A3Q9FYR1_STRLT|nr:hypothetical protein [Streptomyces luteoverticillatus]AZQ73333.1 hypothetical protein EKH77_20825 [Streptomyces luteoverticillatus]